MLSKYLLLLFSVIVYSFSLIKYPFKPLPNNSLTILKDTIDTLIFIDTFKVDNIVYADSLSGIIYKIRNKIIIRKTMQLTPLNNSDYSLRDCTEIIILYDDKFRQLDWIYYQVGNTFISRIKSWQFVKYSL
jgi:hypothetical protein